MMNHSIKKEDKAEYMNIVGDADFPKSAGVQSKKKSFQKIIQSEQTAPRKMEIPTTNSKYLLIK